MRGLILALQFLTRLPTPQLRDFDSTELTRCAHWFPWVGLVVGAFVASALWLGGRIDPALGALLGLCVWVWITGALHLDGLADMSDAMGAAHRDRNRFLAVLADPHLGAFGVVSLLLQLITKLTLLTLLARRGDYWGVLLIPAWARWGTLIWARLPPLKAGMAERFGWQVSPITIWLCGVALVIGSIAVPILWMMPLLALAWRQFLLQRLGGMTGDLLGAGVELMESLALLILIIQVSIYG